MPQTFAPAKGRKQNGRSPTHRSIWPWQLLLQARSCLPSQQRWVLDQACSFHLPSLDSADSALPLFAIIHARPSISLVASLSPPLHPSLDLRLLHSHRFKPTVTFSPTSTTATMKYSVMLAASAALALASPQAPAPPRCPGQCGPDEKIETDCNDQSSCMCENGFFDAWKTCRQCLYGPSLEGNVPYELNIKAIDSVSARICAPSATESFQPVWSEVANSLGIFDLGPDAPAVVATASAGAPGASSPPRPAAADISAGAAAAATDGAGSSASAGSDYDSGSGSSVGASAGGRATATNTRSGAGSASPTNGVSAGRGGNSTSPVNPNAGNSAKVVSGLAVAAVGAAVMLAL